MSTPAFDWVAHASGAIRHSGSCPWLKGFVCRCDAREDVETVADLMRLAVQHAEREATRRALERAADHFDRAGLIGADWLRALAAEGESE